MQSRRRFLGSLLGGTPQRLPDPATLITLPGIDHPNTNPVRVGEDLWTRTKAEILKLLGR
jgi:hypothetical protein